MSNKNLLVSFNVPLSQDSIVDNNVYILKVALKFNQY